MEVAFVVFVVLRLLLELAAHFSNGRATTSASRPAAVGSSVRPAPRPRATQHGGTRTRRILSRLALDLEPPVRGCAPLARVQGRRGGRRVVLRAQRDARGELAPVIEARLAGPAEPFVAAADGSGGWVVRSGRRPQVALSLLAGSAWAVERVEVDDGVLRTVLAPGDVPSAALSGVLGHVVDLAAALDGRPALAVAAVPRSGRRVCPYCRDALGGAPRRACGRCGTEHHAACLAEAGGCTLLGCGPTPRGRRRVRAGAA